MKGVDIGETHSRDNNNNNGNENKNDKGDIDVEADDRGGGDIHANKHNSLMSPISLADSSIVNDPEIKERNKQAIIIHKQIQDLLLRIENLENEKLKAQSREELDPLSEESAFKEEEIQKAKRSFSKLCFAISSQVLQKSELHTAKHHDLGQIPQKHDT